MEEALRARLQAQIAGVPADWGMSVQGTAPPRLVLTRVGGGVLYQHDGPSGLRRARVQVDCYAASVGEAKLLGRSVVSALSGWRDGAIRGVFLEAERDLTPQTGLADVLGRVSIDFTVHYQE